MASNNPARPKLHLPGTAFENTLILAAIIGVAFNIGLLVWSWSMLPERVPSHFDFSGKADAWGSKRTLLLLPMISVVFSAVFIILSRYPHIYNYSFKITQENAPRQYALARILLLSLCAEIVWLFAYIEWKTIQTALGSSSGLHPGFMIVLLICIFGTTGAYFWKAYKAR